MKTKITYPLSTCTNFAYNPNISTDYFDKNQVNNL